MADGSAAGPLVALTGGTGFVGRHIIERAARNGFRLRVLARDPSRLPSLPPKTEVTSGDLADPRALGELVAGADAVVHAAGSVRGVTRAQFDRVNAAGSRACVRAAQAAGVPRFLQISSLAAREPTLSPYAASKRAGEEEALALANELAVTVIRPPAVYGPGDREMLPLFRLMARGYAPVFGRADARFSLLFVTDLADAVVSWARVAAAPTGIFEPDDGTAGGYDWPRVCETVAGLTGRPVRSLRLPAALLALPAGFNALAGRLSSFSPMLTPGKIRELRHPDWVCEPGGITEALDWRPAFDLRAGLLETPGWRD